MSRPRSSQTVIVEKWPRLYASDVRALDPAVVKRGTLELTLTLDGVAVPAEIQFVVNSQGLPRWFICPRCSRRVGFLLIAEHPAPYEAFVCRACLGARYLSELRKGRSEKMICMGMLERFVAEKNSTRLTFR
jgi:hypothetical protein